MEWSYRNVLIRVPRYTSQQLHKAAKRLGVVQSMGRTGVCLHQRHSGIIQRHIEN